MKKLAGILAAVIVLSAVFAFESPLAAPKPGMRLASQTLVLRFQGRKPLEVWIEVQLLVVRTGENVNRRAPLYFSSDYDGIVFPSQAKLDARGFARLKLIIAPPSLAGHRRLQGRITVWVLIDEEDGDDTLEGKLVFSYAMGGG